MYALSKLKLAVYKPLDKKLGIKGCVKLFFTFKKCVIANQIKTGHNYDFIEAFLICKSAISCTFGHMLF